MSTVKIDPFKINFESIAQCLNVLRNVHVYCAMSLRSRLTPMKWILPVTLTDKSPTKCWLFWDWTKRKRRKRRKRTWWNHKRPPSGRGLNNMGCLWVPLNGTIELHHNINFPNGDGPTIQILHWKSDIWRRITILKMSPWPTDYRYLYF